MDGWMVVLGRSGGRAHPPDNEETEIQEVKVLPQLHAVGDVGGVGQGSRDSSSGIPRFLAF